MNKEGKLKILLVADEVWDDYLYGNNVLTNWFLGFDADFAEIYCSPGVPNNNICSKYFQITDFQMFKSMFSKKKAGSSFVLIENENENNNENSYSTFYRIMKNISKFINTPMLMIRDFIWINGRYDIEKLSNFINDFNPNIVFCPRLAAPKMLRLEKIISRLTNAPLVAFTGDDEVSYNQKNYSLLFWLRRFLLNKMLEKTINIYSHYFFLSESQALEYKKRYKISTSTLYKYGNFKNDRRFIKQDVNEPIKLVYAGKLYCNRWRTLAEIGKALKIINNESEKIILEIYTHDILSFHQRRYLSPKYSIYMKGAVSCSELVEIYEKADIALHVESMDKKNRLATKVSFSTKIIDLMESGCAIMAICWEKHNGFEYLKKNDAAICISDYKEILPTLGKIYQEREIINKYAEKAWICGKMKHEKQKNQRDLLAFFQKIALQK
jgi:hypothetical protein